MNAVQQNLDFLVGVGATVQTQVDIVIGPVRAVTSWNVDYQRLITAAETAQGHTIN